MIPVLSCFEFHFLGRDWKIYHKYDIEDLPDDKAIRINNEQISNIIIWKEVSFEHYYSYLGVNGKKVKLFEPINTFMV